MAMLVKTIPTFLMHVFAPTLGVCLAAWFVPAATESRTSKCPRFCHVADGSAAFVTASQSAHSDAGGASDTVAAQIATDIDTAIIVHSALIDSPPV